MPTIKSILLGIGDPVLDVLIARLDELPELHRLITSAIAPEASAVITEEISSELGLTSNWISIVSFFGMVLVGLLRLKPRSAKPVALPVLKIDYNKKDGYYFHVTNSQLNHVPAHFFRKATLKNSERFGTEELARIEGDMLEAREKSANLEYTIFMRIREEVGKVYPTSATVSSGDCDG